MCLSTQKVARTARDWLAGLLDAVIHPSLGTSEQALAEVVDYLTYNARRANMKRDKDTPLFKFDCHPAFNITMLDDL